MTPNDPGLSGSIGHDALNVWMDFWELTGRLRVDILRLTEAGGDPSKMIPPDVSTTTIAGAPAVLVGKDIDPITDRSGEIQSGCMQLELIDRVYKTDRLVIYGIKHEIVRVDEKDYGDFSIWTAKTSRIE